MSNDKNIPDKPRVSFILRGRFPTEKAYGITTAAMISELRKSGYEVDIWALKTKTHGDLTGVKHYKSNLIIDLLIHVARSGTRLFSKVSWKLAWVLLFKKNRSAIEGYGANIYWTRDFLATTILNFHSDKNVNVVEVHETPKFLSKTVHTLPENIIFAPISRIIERQLFELNKDWNVVLSPMGISQEQLATDSDIRNFCQELKIKGTIKAGYIGKLMPGGYSKGYEVILNLLKNPAIEVVIAGFLENEKSILEERLGSHSINLERVSIHPHMPHSTALKIMKSCDLLVLTAPKSNNYVGFPLKTLEYLAAGRVVLAEDCQLYRDIFNDERIPFWFVSDNSLSILQAASEALLDPKIEERILRGREFASTFQWSSRLNRILQEVNQTKSS